MISYRPRIREPPPPTRQKIKVPRNVAETIFRETATYFFLAPLGATLTGATPPLGLLGAKEA